MHAAQSRRLLGDSMSAPEILATLAADDPVAFTRHVLPVVREASMASRAGQTARTGGADDAFGMPPSRQPDTMPAMPSSAGWGRRSGQPPARETRTRTRQSGTWPARPWPPSSSGRRGIRPGHPDLLGDAAAWLRTGPYALDQGWLRMQGSPRRSSPRSARHSRRARHAPSRNASPPTPAASRSTSGTYTAPPPTGCFVTSPRRGSPMRPGPARMSSTGNFPPPPAQPATRRSGEGRSQTSRSGHRSAWLLSSR